MDDTSILLEIKDQVATITLNRPHVFNSFNRKMAFQFQDALDDCKSNDDVRAVVITGKGKAFGAGQDLKEVTDPELNPGFSKILEEHYNPIISRIRSLEKPVVAAVNGVAAGAAANIALACDIVVADQQASFIQAFSKIGLIPDSEKDKHFLALDHLAIYFVDRTGTSSQVEKIEFDSYGSFKKVPINFRDFFSDDLREAAKLARIRLQAKR